MTTIVPPAPSTSWCLFLDVDGTLIELTDTPFETRAGGDLKRLLTAVSGRLDGALALVSGRSLATLDGLFDPLRLPAAGLHGVERRSAAGLTATVGQPGDRLDPVRDALRALVGRHPGTLLEDKGRTIALHFRLAPRAGGAVRDAVAALAAGLGPDYEVQGGDMLVEIKPRGVDKGDAVEAFMREPPFGGRLPVYVGDDLTDLHAFRAVEAQGGFAVAVGGRVEGAYRLADPAAVRAWLGAFVAPWPP